MTRSLVAELAQRLGKSEEEVIRFFQILWQIMPPSPETQPYFFRYLDERFLWKTDTQPCGRSCANRLKPFAKRCSKAMPRCSSKLKR